jgi:anhydro-N-acetylmuramic acid kinase
MGLYIGIMSGTSLDGVDVALIDINQHECQLKHAKTYSFDEKLHQQLLKLIVEQESKLFDFGEIDIKLGQFIASCINQFLAEYRIEPKQVIAIGSHGQTIFHSPNSNYPFSMQIGNANEIAQLTAITTVADFRQRDIAADGQGAPLVPAYHKEVFGSEVNNRVILNIGGMSNLTIIPADKNESVFGFDSGPGNVLMDAWIFKKKALKYDANGDWAKSGQINEPLLNSLLSEPFFRQQIPKSTGRELFNLAWLETKIDNIKSPISDEDIQATLLALTTVSIAEAIKLYAAKTTEIYLCGGGAQNKALCSQLESLLTNTIISDTEVLGIHPDWVEACAFAWLAYKNIAREEIDLTSVTGAKSPVILGATYWSNEAS